MGFQDFLDYRDGVKRLERFLPRTRSLIIIAVMGVAAWYSHIVLVLLVCGALVVAGQAADLATGLIIEGEALRREHPGLQSDPELTIKRLENDIHKIRQEIEALKGGNPA